MSVSLTTYPDHLKSNYLYPMLSLVSRCLIILSLDLQHNRAVPLTGDVRVPESGELLEALQPRAAGPRGPRQGEVGPPA